MLEKGYIQVYTGNGKGKTTAALDHFYPKSRYPILALSLYNFIILKSSITTPMLISLILVNT